MVDHKNTPQVTASEKFTHERSYFKLYSRKFHLLERNLPQGWKEIVPCSTKFRIGICEFDEKFQIWFNEDTVSQMFISYIQFDCEAYALSDTFNRIEIEL